MTTIKLGGVPFEGSAAQCFMEQLDAISKSHPLDPKAFIVDNCSVHCSPSNGNTAIHINSMDSMIKGSGTIALTKMCEIADACGVTMSLLAFGYADTPTKKLVEWYSRFGFQTTGLGNAKEGFRMKREPMLTKVEPIRLKGFDRPH